MLARAGRQKGVEALLAALRRLSGLENDGQPLLHQLLVQIPPGLKDFCLVGVIFQRIEHMPHITSNTP